MKKAILVAHGEGGKGTFSIPKAKTITRANHYLYFNTAIDYMKSSNTWPEYSSTSFGQFGPLSNSNCQDLFNTIPAGTGIVDTGLRRGGDVGGTPIYALRTSGNVTQSTIDNFIKTNRITSLVILACRA